MSLTYEHATLKMLTRYTSARCIPRPGHLFPSDLIQCHLLKRSMHYYTVVTYVHFSSHCRLRTKYMELFPSLCEKDNMSDLRTGLNN